MCSNATILDLMFILPFNEAVFYSNIFQAIVDICIYWLWTPISIEMKLESQSEWFFVALFMFSFPLLFWNCFFYFLLVFLDLQTFPFCLSRFSHLSKCQIVQPWFCLKFFFLQFSILLRFKCSTQKQNERVATWT